MLQKRCDVALISSQENCHWHGACDIHSGKRPITLPALLPTAASSSPVQVAQPIPPTAHCTSKEDAGGPSTHLCIVRIRTRLARERQARALRRGEAVVIVVVSGAAHRGAATVLPVLRV